MNGQFSIFMIDCENRSEDHDLSWHQAYSIAMGALYDNLANLVKGVSVEIRSNSGVVFTASNPKAVEAQKPVNTYREHFKDGLFDNRDDMRTAIKMLEPKQIPIEVLKYSKVCGCYSKKGRLL